MTSESKEMTEPLPPAEDDTPDRLTHEDMLDQLGAMVRQIAGEAPPALREASVVAAELTAVAARNTGPLAHTIADVTDDASLRLAQRLEDYAASVRQKDGALAEASGAEVVPAEASGGAESTDTDEETPGTTG